MPLLLSNLEEASHKKIILEASFVKFGGRLVSGVFVVVFFMCGLFCIIDFLCFCRAVFFTVFLR